MYSAHNEGKSAVAEPWRIKYINIWLQFHEMYILMN